MRPGRCITLLCESPTGSGDIEAFTPKQINQVEQDPSNDRAAALGRSGTGTILVSNEVGLGLAPPSQLGNTFRDIAGRINRLLAQQADRVV